MKSCSSRRVSRGRPCGTIQETYGEVQVTVMAGKMIRVAMVTSSRSILPRFHGEELSKKVATVF